LLRSRFSLLSHAVALAGLILTTACTGIDPKAPPVDNYGQLQIANGKLVSMNQEGQPVQLKGMSLYWSDWGSAWWNESAVDQAVDYLGCQIIRAPLAVADASHDDSTGYLFLPDENKARMERVVNEAIYKGIYVIIDWHDSAAEKPSHTAAAIDFFTKMAREYGNKPNVLFEIYNEPVSDWDTAIKPYAEAVIAAIRSTPGADSNPTQNVIIVGTPNYSQFGYAIGSGATNAVLANPITDFPNIAYTLHFYAASHYAGLRNWADQARQAGLALVVTEWGVGDINGTDLATTSAGEPSFSQWLQVYVQPWVDWMNSNSISWCNFDIFDKVEASSIFQAGTSPVGPWTDASLTALDGNYVKSLLPAPNTPLIVSPSLLSFPYVGGTQAATVTTAGTYTASSDSLWLKFTQDTNGSGTINASADVNNGTSPLRGTINLVDPSGQDGKAHIVVSQEYNDGNLAKHKTASASSFESGSYPPDAATDGDEVDTRWSSRSGSSGEWIAVNLGDTYTIGAVKLLWEAAYSRSYHIQLSPDGTDGSWANVFDSGPVAFGLGPHTDVLLITSSVRGQYVRMLSDNPANTNWGNSLYEFEVFAAGSGGAISASPLAASVAANGAVSSILVSSSGTWTAKSSDTTGWLTVTPASATASGAGPLSFVVHANTNGTGNSRTATVTLSGPGGAQQVVTFTQSAAVGYVLLTPFSGPSSYLTFPVSAGQQSVVIDSNIDWIVSLSTNDGGNWLHPPNPASGHGNGVVTFSYDANSTGMSRGGTITIQDNDGFNLSTTLSLQQLMQ
jgi:endoglucanase